MFNIFKSKKKDTKLFYHTDVHCHILPGVDHGSQSLEDSLNMIRAELEMGINRIILTSHVTAETFENTPETLNAAFETLQEAVKSEGLEVELFVSAEYRIDEYWNKEYKLGNQIPMPGKFILLENSFQQEMLELDDLLFDLQTNGYKPILAHPERYSYYAVRRTRLEQLHSKNVKFQVNLLSLAGYFGPGAKELANWLIKNNMCDMLGSDMHNMSHAKTISDFLASKEWRKIEETLKGRIMNDWVR